MLILVQRQSTGASLQPNAKSCGLVAKITLVMKRESRLWFLFADPEYRIYIYIVKGLMAKGLFDTIAKISYRPFGNGVICARNYDFLF